MEDVKCDDGEAMDHYGQTLRVITYDEDRNLTIACTSKYSEEENDIEKSYLCKYVSRTQCKNYYRKIISFTEILRR